MWVISEQADGFLQANSSYNFNREENQKYRSRPINSGDFFAWQKDHMYRSSYAQHHSPVKLDLFRIASSQRIQLLQVTKDLFQGERLIVYMAKVTL